MFEWANWYIKLNAYILCDPHWCLLFRWSLVDGVCWNLLVIHTNGLANTCNYLKFNIYFYLKQNGVVLNFWPLTFSFTCVTVQPQLSGSLLKSFLHHPNLFHVPKPLENSTSQTKRPLSELTVILPLNYLILCVIHLWFELKVLLYIHDCFS